MLLYLFAIFLLSESATSKSPYNFELEAEYAKMKRPVMSEVYSVRGTLNIPGANVKEPFQAWYDARGGVSRIDYYGGMLKTYRTKGSNLQVYQQRTASGTCFQINDHYEESEKDYRMSVLPDLSYGYMFDGFDDEFPDNQTQLWIMYQDMYTYSYFETYDIFEKNKLWVQVRKPTGPTTDAVPVPLRFETRRYANNKRWGDVGKEYDYFYLDYENYNVEDIPKEVFAPDPNINCLHFSRSLLHSLQESPFSRVIRSLPLEYRKQRFNPMGDFIYPQEHFNIDIMLNQLLQYEIKDTYMIFNFERFVIFHNNLRFVSSMNRANLGYTLSMNHLAVKYDREIADLIGKGSIMADNGASPFPYTAELLAQLKDEIPKEWNWWRKGGVFPVKDQSRCGSSWAFGATGAIEGALFLHNGGHLKKLSEQALIDCSGSYGNKGCHGGEDFRSYQWMMKHGGIPLEDEYGKYLAKDGVCHIDNVTLVAPITGYVNVTPNDPNALRVAIFKHGPVSVAINASPKTFLFYSSGVYYDKKCDNELKKLNHAVLAIGYGTLNGEDYWIIKNSWSKRWGDNGYILMSAKNNNCGVQTAPTYVTM